MALRQGGGESRRREQEEGAHRGAAGSRRLLLSGISGCCSVGSSRHGAFTALWDRRVAAAHLDPADLLPGLRQDR